jgi:RHS repeat-associated protein
MARTVSLQSAKSGLRAGFFLVVAALSCGAPEQADLGKTEQALLDPGCKEFLFNASSNTIGSASVGSVPGGSEAIAPASLYSQVQYGTTPSIARLEFRGRVGLFTNQVLTSCEYSSAVAGLVGCEDCVPGSVLIGGTFAYSTCATKVPSSSTGYHRFESVHWKMISSSPSPGFTNSMSIYFRDRLNDDNPCTIDTCVNNVRTYTIDTSNSFCVQPSVPDRAIASNPAQDAATVFSTQLGTPGALDPKRAGIVFGQVAETLPSRASKGLAGAIVTVVGQPQYGRALTRADGSFEFALNGGGQVTFEFSKAGYISAQRYVKPKWREFVRMDDVEIQPHDDGAGTVVAIPAGGTTTAGGYPKLVQGRQIAASEDGVARRSTMMIPTGLTATNFTSPTGNYTMHLTEFTAGPGGFRRMPGTLPANSGYTFAFDAQVDEAKAAGVGQVTFNKAIPFYVENFLNFPVGETVPVGYYDEAKSQWVAEESGTVIKLVSYTGTPALAQISIDAGGTAIASASTLNALGITLEERQQLASAYPSGTTLWRAKLTHFSKYDLNWAWGPPPNASAPNAPPPEPSPDLPNSCEAPGGSSVSCQNRTLSEELPIVGTNHTLRYQSDRSGPNKQLLRVFLKGTTAPLATPVSTEYFADIAGRRFAGSYPWLGTPASVDVEWDGKDAFGRAYLGGLTAHVSVGYTYASAYQRTAGFGQDGQSVTISGGARRNATFWKEYDVKLSSNYDARGLKFGGWMLTGHHVYDPTSSSLILSNGGVTATAPTVLERVAGAAYVGTVQDTSPPVPIGDGGNARNAPISAQNILALADGSVVLTERSRLRKIDPSGIISTFTGVDPQTALVDGALAFNAKTLVASLAQHPITGELHFLELYDASFATGGRVWKISNGIVRLVAGGQTAAFQNCAVVGCGDGLAATHVSAQLVGPQFISFGPDGTLYIAESLKLRKVDPAGIISTKKTFSSAIRGLLVGSGGEIWTSNSNAVYRTGVDSVTTLVPNTTATNQDGLFPSPFGTIGRIVNTNSLSGIGELWSDTTRMAGGGNPVIGPAGTSDRLEEGKLPLRASFGSIRSASTGPNGEVYFTSSSGVTLWRIRPGPAVTLPSPDGSELYIVDADGNHLKTVTARTGATVNTFGYTGGVLTSIADADGLTTNIARSGNTVTITAPKGQVTTLTTDANGYLSKFEKPVVNAVRDTWTFTTGANGKLASQVDARGFTHTYIYDAGNRIISDTDAAGATLNFSASQLATGLTVTKTSAEGRLTTYGVVKTGIGDAALTFQPNGGPITTQARNADGTEITNYLRASLALPATPVLTTESRIDPDPRLGLFAPIRSERTTSAYGVGNLSFRSLETRTAPLATPGDLTSLISETRTIKTNPDSVPALAFDSPMVGEPTWVDTFTRSTNTRVITTPVGRQMTYAYDSKDRVISASSPGTSAITYSYNAEGRLYQVIQGTRSVTMGYDAFGTLATVTDHTGRQVSYTRDALGRATLTTMPGARNLLTTWDANNNASFVTPPGKPQHAQTFDPRDLLTSYTPPDAALLAPNAAKYTYTWNNDRQVTSITRPEGLITLGYYLNGATNEGTLKTITNAVGEVLTFTRDTANRTRGIAITTAAGSSTVTANGANLGFDYTGAMLTQVNWTGPFTQSVAYDYNHHFKPKTITVAGTPFTIAYDADDLLSTVGFGTSSVQLARDATNGRINGTTMSTTSATSVTETRSFDATYGELRGLSYAKGAALYDVTYGRDALGRVSTKTETIGGVATVATYTYDTSGRLASETRAGVTTNWAYDLNGNRVTVNGTTVAGVDTQDRYSPTTAANTYDNAGNLKTKPGAVYTWDTFGNYTKAVIGGATTVDYGYDGQNRRVFRKVGGVLTNQYVYDGQLRIVAETTPTATRRFAYASKSNVPDAMLETVATVTTAYKIVSDQLGSVRLVVRMSDGVVVSRLDYDAWGNIVSSTGVGVQPFGFAGGLYDAATQLVRFGARDYDPSVGRWTSKDPSRWKGGANFYAYANEVDPVVRTKIKAC